MKIREEIFKMTETFYESTDKKEEKMVGENVGFERIRRITGYLVGTLDRFNNAKLAEVNDRVKHGMNA